MSKTGNHRIEIQGTADYRFGWESAERGEPEPTWTALVGDCEAMDKLEAQRIGWCDFHNQEATP